MQDIFSYKRYSIVAEYYDDDKVYFGRVNGIDDYLLVEGATLDEFETHFHTAIDDYLGLCADIGKEPNEPNKNFIS